jgi:hypothetical protein
MPTDVEPLDDFIARLHGQADVSMRRALGLPPTPAQPASSWAKTDALIAALASPGPLREQPAVQSLLRGQKNAAMRVPTLILIQGGRQ